METSNEKIFIEDILDEIMKRHCESQRQMKANPNDAFNVGRALAFQEVKEIIENRLEIYEVKLTEFAE